MYSLQVYGRAFVCPKGLWALNLHHSAEGETCQDTASQLFFLATSFRICLEKESCEQELETKSEDVSHDWKCVHTVLLFGSLNVYVLCTEPNQSSLKNLWFRILFTIPFRPMWKFFHKWKKHKKTNKKTPTKTQKYPYFQPSTNAVGVDFFVHFVGLEVQIPLVLMVPRFLLLFFLFFL